MLEDAIGTEIAAAGGFGFVPGGGDGFGADRAGHLQDHGTDTTGAASDEEPFIGLELSALAKSEVSRDSDEGAGGSVVVGDLWGDGVEPLCIDSSIFGESALSSHETLVASPYAIANSELMDLVTDFDHLTG